MLKENGRKIIKYLQEVGTEDVNLTAADIAENLGMSLRVVNGFITSVSPASRRQGDPLVETEAGAEYDVAADEAEAAEKELHKRKKKAE